MLKAAAVWVIYPMSWIFILFLYHLYHKDILLARDAWITLIAVLIIVYCSLEHLLPYQKRWSMTQQTLKVDLKYLVMNGTFLGMVSFVLSLFTISIANTSSGPASTFNLPVQVLMCFLLFEAIQYSIHRLMHESRGKLGRFLWRLHSIHHLPNRVYVLMHAVAHPLNQILLQTLAIVLPIWYMGYSESVVLLFLMVNSMHGLISHFNVDVRMGVANYLFIGPELHRQHHSAETDQSGNYGATLSLYDQWFGTFIYTPHHPPETLGIADTTKYPNYSRIGQALLYPFRSK